MGMTMELTIAREIPNSAFVMGSHMVPAAWGRHRQPHFPDCLQEDALTILPSLFLVLLVLDAHAAWAQA